MIELTLSKFWKGKYDDHGELHSLYVLKAGTCVLYIGISREDIWRRWFNAPSSHLSKVAPSTWCFNSKAGEAVLRCYPESMKWVIELWTADDCIPFLELETRFEQKRVRRDIRHAESLMIEKLRPALNSAGAAYRVDWENLPECIKRYQREQDAEADRVYKEMFKAGADE